MQHYQAETILSHIEKMLLAKLPDCLIPVTPSEQLIKNPMNWWQGQSCSGNFQTFQYYYVVEPLVRDSCAIVAQEQGSAAYFRITLLVQMPLDTPLFLQSTLVKSSIEILPCETKQHLVQMGRQAWRELNY